MAAADLHHLVVAAGVDGGEDLAGQHLAELGVAVLVDVLHASTCKRGSGVDEQRVALGDRVDERDLDAAAYAVLVLAQRQRARLVDAHDPHCRRLVAARDAAVLVVAGDGRRDGHSIRLALSSIELLLVVGAHALEQLQRRRRLLLVDLREREADVDQDPVAGLRAAVAVGVEQADVDRALDAGDVHLREPIDLIDHFHDLAGNRQAHRGSTHSSRRDETTCLGHHAPLPDGSQAGA